MAGHEMDAGATVQADLKGQRFHLPWQVRVPLTTAVSFFCGLVYGMHNSHSKAGTRYLIENSHRLPTTKGGWYWYYKRKNWVCLQAAVKGGLKTGVKTGGFTFLVFGLEAVIDSLRGHVDCLNTVATSVIVGGAYTKLRGLTLSASVVVLKKGLLIGVVGGMLQDLLMLRRGELWYINEIDRATRLIS